MRRALLIGALAAALGLPAPASAADVRVMVAGQREVLREAGDVALRARAVRVAGRRCAVAARTPLAALLATRLRLRLTDYGRCGRRAADSGSLYVRQVGGERARGQDGWVYKVGRRVGSAGAADPAGPFGRGGLRGGQDVLWFWCVSGAQGCQRTLGVELLGGGRVRVRGYDDNGRGVPVAGATARCGAATAVTGADGTATLPIAPGELVTATMEGMVASFPVRA